MGGIVSLAIFGLIIVALALGTRKGLVYIALPAVFAYPHRLNMGLMPMNAGFDDMLVILTFVIMIIKGFRIKGRWMGWMIAILYFIVIGAETTSVGLTGGGMIQTNIKTILKATVILSYGLTLLMTMETEDDVRRIILSLAAAGGLACVIAMADWMGMEWAKMFFVEVDIEHEMMHSRATGSFLSTDGVGITLAMVGWLGASHLIFRSTLLAKFASLLWCMLLIVTLVASASRSGMLGVALSGVAILLFARRRRAMVLMLYAIPVMVIAMVPVLREAFLTMLSRTEAQAAEGGIWAGTGRSSALWTVVDYSLGPWTAFFGAGETFYGTRGWYAHNGFVDVLLCFGLAGVIWGAFFLNRILRQAFFLMKHGTSFLARNLGIAVLLGLLGTAGTSLATGPPMNTFWRYEIMWVGAVLSVMMRLHIGQEKPIALEPYEEYDEFEYEGMIDGEGEAEGGIARN